MHTIKLEMPDNFAVTIGGVAVEFESAKIADKVHTAIWLHGWRKLNDAFASRKSATLKAGGAWLPSDESDTRDAIAASVLDGSIADQTRGTATPIDPVGKLASAKAKEEIMLTLAKAAGMTTAPGVVPRIKSVYAMANEAVLAKINVYFPENGGAKFTWSDDAVGEYIARVKDRRDFRKEAEAELAKVAKAAESVDMGDL